MFESIASSMNKSEITPAQLEKAIRNVPDFPKPGIQFKDITPVLADAQLFRGCIDLLTANFRPGSVDAVVGIDARGFIFAAAAALLKKVGADILELGFLIELGFLKGREKLKGFPVRSLIVY